MGLTANSSDVDPLTLAVTPPPDETSDQKASRQRAEADAKRRSDEIDSMLAAEAATLKKKKQKEIRVLLLGQSESGKSTTLKNFQLAYAQKAWTAEKSAWRTVIQLNVVRSVNLIVAAVEQGLDDYQSGGNNDQFPDGDGELSSDIDEIPLSATAESSRASAPSPFTTRPSLSPASAAIAALGSSASELRPLLERLKSLRAVQKTLERLLGREDDNETTSETTNGFGLLPAQPHKPQEFYVRAATGWKDALQRIQSQMRTRYSVGSANESHSRERRDDVGTKLANSSKDMVSLWNNPAVREIVDDMKGGLGDEAEFFLNNIARVADPLYTPTDSDVIRARLRTMGVQEHRIGLESGAYAGREWVIYDVGGSRSQRAQWAPYFESVHAIIFLAPLSPFDQHLPEDPRVNRLDDTVQLWKQVCANKLLKDTEMVVFLNKQDLLERKLASGIRFGDWVKSYRGPEDAQNVSKYVRAKFQDVFRQSSRSQNALHIFATSVVDTKATALTLVAVQDGILRKHLMHLDLI